MDAPSTAPHRPPAWRVVVPVKDARIGKSRLVATWSEADEQLRRAIADDTVAAVAAALGPRQVVVVTSDPVLGPRWSTRGVTVCADPGQGLNAAISLGLRRAGAQGELTAALLGDLPALTAGDLLAVLAEAARHDQSFVPDRDGTGTVLRCGHGFTPRFGPASAAAHEADGAVRLAVDLPRLRTDVDDRESLLLARTLGVGRSTDSALRRLGLG